VKEDTMHKAAALLVAVILSSLILQASVLGETVSLTVDLPGAHEYQVTEKGSGHELGFPECGYLMMPGRPMLPTKNFLVGLPPGMRARAVEVEPAGPEDLPGEYWIASAPAPVRLDGGGHRPALHNDASTFSSLEGQRDCGAHDIFPPCHGRIKAQGSLRGYRYVAVSVCPFAYYPGSGRLVRYDSAVIRVATEPIPAPARESEAEEIRTDAAQDGSTGDQLASEHLVNFDEIGHLYRPVGEGPEAPLQVHDYVIITTSTQQAAVTASDFIAWKTSLGYSVRVVLTTDPEIAGQPGADLAQRIRNFLRAYYPVWGIEYVLLVGDYATVPMRYCYPDPSNHTNTAGTPGGTGGEVPTDYYYADLSDPDELSWDSDGDGFHGEYGEDNPDFMAEVYVGRIPHNNLTYITNALNKTVTFEGDTGAWKMSALHPSAFWYFTHEINDTAPAMDAAKLLSYIETDFMAGWTVTRFSEQAGLEASAYPWPAITHAAFADAWRTGQYSVVNWGAHGWSNSIARKVWDWDDGDGIPESAEFIWPDMLTTLSDLDDDFPSIVTAVSCYVGIPEPNDWGRLGVKMLTRPGWGPAVGVIASARSPYGSLYWPPGGSESIIYEFNRLMIESSEKVGQALYNSKFYCTTNYGWENYAEYIDMYTFNLFGDPSLTREGIEIAGVVPGSEGGRSGSGAELIAGPSPTRGDVSVRYYVPSDTQADLAVFNVLGQRVRSLVASHRSEGWHEACWSGARDDGTDVASGIYWVRLELPGEIRTERIIRLR
jgi:hypothetical protein